MCVNVCVFLVATRRNKVTGFADKYANPHEILGTFLMRVLLAFLFYCL